VQLQWTLRSWRAVLPVLGALVLLAPTANAGLAAAPISIAFASTGQLVAHLMVVVPVTITCAPSTPLTYVSAQVSLRQAVVKNTAIATAFASLGDINAPLGNGSSTSLAPSGSITCDTAPHTYSIGLIPAQPPLFARGQALVNGTVTECTGTPEGSPPFISNVFSNCGTVASAALPQVIRIVPAGRNATIKNTRTINAIHVNSRITDAAERAAVAEQ
jgi:hypothetical protein